MTEIDIPVLTIDGPSGSGKGTIGQLCAHQLSWHYLDSGAIYRALAYVADKHNISNQQVDSLLELALNMKLVCHVRLNDVAEIEVNGELVTDKLRCEEMGELASKIAPIPSIRDALLSLQLKSRQAPGLVADGRDMASTVFKDAQYKVFLTASAEIRAQRRFEQLKSKGFNANLARLLESIQARDVRDSNRAVSPLKAVDDALILDTSEMSIDEVVSRVLDLVQSHSFRSGRNSVK